MSNELDKQLQDYYLNQRPSESLTQELLLVSQLAQSANRWKQRTMIAVSALTVAVCLLVVSFVWHSGNGSVENNEFVGPANEIEVPVINPQDSKSSPVNSEVPIKLVSQFRLVAVQSHGDQCPFCRETDQVYRELITRFDPEVIDFEQIELEKPPSRAEVEERIDQFQLTSRIEGRSETAFLALTTLDGEMIQEFKPSMGVSTIQAEIQKVLKR